MEPLTLELLAATSNLVMSYDTTNIDLFADSYFQVVLADQLEKVMLVLNSCVYLVIIIANGAWGGIEPGDPVL